MRKAAYVVVVLLCWCVVSHAVIINFYFPKNNSFAKAEQLEDDEKFIVWAIADVQGDWGGATKALEIALQDLEDNDISWDIHVSLGDIERGTGNTNDMQDVEDIYHNYLDNVTYGGRTHNRSDVYLVMGNHDNLNEDMKFPSYRDDYTLPIQDGWNPYDWAEWHPGEENEWRKWKINLTDSEYDNLNDDHPASDNPSDCGYNDKYVYGVCNYTVDVGNLKFVAWMCPPEDQRFPNASLNWLENIMINNPDRMFITWMHYRMDNRSANPRNVEITPSAQGFYCWGAYSDVMPDYDNEQHPEYIETLNRIIARPNYVMWLGGHQQGFPSYYDDIWGRWHGMVFVENTSATLIPSVVNDTYPPHNVTHINCASLGRLESEILHPIMWSCFIEFTNNSRKVSIKSRVHGDWLNDDNNWYQKPGGGDYPNEYAETWGNISYAMQEDGTDYNASTYGYGTEVFIWLPEPFVFFPQSQGSEGTSDFVEIVSINGQSNNTNIYVENRTICFTDNQYASEYHLQFANDSSFTDVFFDLDNISGYNPWLASLDGFEWVDQGDTIFFAVPYVFNITFSGLHYYRIRGHIKS